MDHSFLQKINTQKNKLEFQHNRKTIIKFIELTKSKQSNQVYSKYSMIYMN